MSGNPAVDESAATPSDESAAAATPAPPPAPAVVLPPENVVRGLLLSLVVVPVGIVVFTIIYNLGFIASIIAFGVAFAAWFLYRIGSGGRVSVIGSVIITVVTLGTLVLAFLVAQAFVVAVEFAAFYEVSWTEVLFAPEFPALLAEVQADPEISSAFASDALFTAIFGLLGCGAVLFNVFRAARAEAKAIDGPAATPGQPA